MKHLPQVGEECLLKWTIKNWAVSYVLNFRQRGVTAYVNIGRNVRPHRRPGIP